MKTPVKKNITKILSFVFIRSKKNKITIVRDANWNTIRQNYSVLSFNYFCIYFQARNLAKF